MVRPGSAEGLGAWAVAKGALEKDFSPAAHLTQWAGIEAGDESAAQVHKQLGIVSTQAVAKTLEISTLSAGGVLVTGDRIDNFFRPLRNESVVLRFNPIQRNIVDGAITVTGLETDVSITWDGEVGTQEIDTEPTWGDRSRPTHFARALVPISNKSLRSSASPQILADVNDSLRFAFAIGFDTKWINGTGVSYGPKGLRANAGETNNSLGDTFDNITDDAKGARKRMAINSVPMRNLGWLMSKREETELMFLRNTNDNFVFRDEMMNGTWFGVQYEATNEVATNEGAGSNESFLMLVDFSGVLVGTGTALEIRTFDGASYTAGGTVYNTAETDETLIRGVAETTLLVAQPEFIEEVDQVTWGA